MATLGEQVAGASKSEVTIASSPGEAPRLDFSHFSIFGIEDDASKSALPRSKSSGHIAHPLRTAERDSHEKDNTAESLDERCVRARSQCDRGGMGDLIDFLREPPPPDYIQMPSTFEFDLGHLDDDQEEPGKWKQLTKKLKMKLTKPTSPAGEVHIKLKLTEPAVAARTAEGTRHMAISVPMEHCALGPDSDWAVPSYNATKPLPPSPQRGPRKGSIPGHTRGAASASDSLSTDIVLTVVPAKAVPRMEYDESAHPSSIRLWQHMPPISPPQSPPSRAGSEGRSPSTPAQAPRAVLPSDPGAYVELPMPPPPSGPITPESIMEDRVRNIHQRIKTTARILQSAPGPPPPSSAPNPLPYSTFHPARPGPTKPLPKRPDFNALPVRRSSLKKTTPVVSTNRTRPSLDQVLRNERPQEVEADPAVERPEPSPKSISCHSLASSILTVESEPVVTSARAVRGLSTASIVLQTTPGTTPRASLIRLSSSEKYASPISPGEKDGSPYKAQRKASTRTNCSRKSRAERVKSLKQRDMELARVQAQQRQIETEIYTAAGIDRPGTADTVKDHSPQPPRQGADKALVWGFAESFPRPPTADASDDSDNVFRSFSTDSTDDSANTLNRESYCSSTGPRRYDSYLRTSWASSIPLLDRISSYTPSETSFMQILDSAGPAVTQKPHRRSDSATLPRIEQERLTPSRLSRVSSVQSNMNGSDTPCASRRGSTFERSAPSSTGSVHKAGSFLSTGTPRPSTPPDERWSATTVQSPGPMATKPSPSPAPSNGTRKDRMSPELTPPVSRRGSPEQCNNCGHGTETERSSMLPFSLEEDARRAQLQQVGHIHHGIWSPASMQNLNSHMDDGAKEGKGDMQQHFGGARQQRGSRSLLRMSSAELHAHYDNLHRTDRASDVAHHILLNQERMEFELRRQEQNQKLSYARLVHNQMMFFSELERQFEGMGRVTPRQHKPRASLGWNGMPEARQSSAAQPPKHMAKASDTSSMAFELEAMDPLMHDLRDGSRVSSESTRLGVYGAAAALPAAVLPTAVGGRELDAYFNMI